jgi:hypothetical protein
VNVGKLYLVSNYTPAKETASRQYYFYYKTHFNGHFPYNSLDGIRPILHPRHTNPKPPTPTPLIFQISQISILRAVKKLILAFYLTDFVVHDKKDQLRSFLSWTTNKVR